MFFQGTYGDKCNYLDNFYPGFMELQDLYDHYCMSKSCEWTQEEQVQQLKIILSTAFHYCRSKIETLEQSEFDPQSCNSKMQKQHQLLRHLENLKLSNFNLSLKELEGFVELLMTDVIIPDELDCLRCPKSGSRKALKLQVQLPRETLIRYKSSVEPADSPFERDKKSIVDIINLISYEPVLLEDDAFYQSVIDEVKEFIGKHCESEREGGKPPHCQHSFYEGLVNLLDMLEQYKNGEKDLVIRFLGYEVSLSRRIMH
ncbi:hypothetical protein [Terasakiella sp. SH-1]|uniref:hypothetical protein n=1 Tax=Terasakiella sp. SH-1 TaxID=2560057 RepID=UPI001073475D|nr:hypothetical protein [Terasakiella sp. SH-1]